MDLQRLTSTSQALCALDISPFARHRSLSGAKPSVAGLRPAQPAQAAALCTPLRAARCSRRRVLTWASLNGASPPWAVPDARLALQDGSVWSGKAFGAGGNVVAEVVFNTSITGYQEIMTDPSYQGQFVVFTHPHIGNTGINLGERHRDYMDTFVSLQQWLFSDCLSELRSGNPR